MIIRVNKKENPYVLIDKHFINDERLSYKAKGIVSYLLSKPDNWHIQMTDLVKHSTDGVASIRAGIKELKHLGYLIPVVVRDQDTGRILKHDYDVIERPQREIQQVGNPQCDFQLVDNQLIDNRIVNNKRIKVNNKLTKGIDKINNNNSSSNGKKQKNIITIPIKNKKEFNKIKPEIINLGWVGSLDEIIEFHNADPEYVEGWVNQISKINQDKPGAWAGLLRKLLRSGERVPTKKEIETSLMNKYIDDPYYAECIE